MIGSLGERMWAHLSSSLITPVALRRDAAMLTSSSKKMRVFAPLPRLGMNFGLLLAATRGVSRYHMRAPVDTISAGLNPDCALALNVANRRIPFSNGSRRRLFLGFDALGMPVFSPRSAG